MMLLSYEDPQNLKFKTYDFQNYNSVLLKLQLKTSA